MPAGNAALSMPSVSFTSSNAPVAPANWSSTSSTGPVGVNTYNIIDNLTWVKGRHNLTFGAQIQWLETNGGSFGGFSKTLSLSFNNDDSENCIASSVQTCPANLNGNVYASYLVGAVNSGSVTAQAIQDVGGRFRPMAPYFNDNWQVTSKLTLNLGLRYDYLQPYHEVKDRIAFLNSAITNPIVGIKGVLEYGGFPTASTPATYAPYICHCTTPVHPYNKNFEPNVSFSYAASQSTVFSGSFTVHVTHAGGSGGGTLQLDSNGNPVANTATSGTGNNGEYQASTTWNQAGGTTGNPAFFLNAGYAGSPTNATYAPPVQGTQPATGTPGVLGPQIACITAGTCSPYTALPPWLVPGITVNPLQSTGNYNFTSYFPDHANDYICQTSDNITCQPGAVNFADPYYGGRGPQFVTYNFSIQKLINRKAVLSVAYAGSQTHFLNGGSGRGYATNTFSPDYSEKFGSALNGPCSTGCTPPYPGFTGSSATLGQSLKAFPQFGTFSDLWGDTGNASYNALQILVIQRPWHNLNGTIGYTRGKEIDDTGVHRTQYPVGPQDGNFTRNYTANQIDRGLGQNNQTNKLDVTWVYRLPIGRGQAFFATNRIAGLIGGGWQLSGIYSYRDGFPLQITNGGGCMTNSVGGQGTCLPDYTPGFNKRSARINGRWGRGPGANAANINNIQYLNPAAFECPDSSPQNNTFSCGATAEPNTTFKLGNVARSAPDGLTGPGSWQVHMGLRRVFSVRETASLHLTFEVEADVDNLTNSTFFNITTARGNTVTWDTATYGIVSGQNKSIQPRDWQFAGRFRF